METKQITQEELQTLVKDISQNSFECLPHIKTIFKHNASFNSKLRTTAGRYFISKGDIEINPKYYKRYGLQELIATIKHELAHYHLHQMSLPYKHKDKEKVKEKGKKKLSVNKKGTRTLKRSKSVPFGINADVPEWLVKSNEIKFSQKLGSGGFAVVYKG